MDAVSDGKRIRGAGVSVRGGRATSVIRILLGLLFVVFGLNGFFHFIPLPDLPREGKNFMEALAQTGYILPMVKGIEVIGGLLLLFNVLVPLALLLLAPGIVNIFLFHLMLAPGGLALAIFLVLLEGYLGFYAYWRYFADIFTVKASSP